MARVVVTPPAVGVTATGASLVPRESYTCDPDPFNGDLVKCQGFLLQCRLVFSQRPLVFASDEAKINYVLQGRALAWVQLSSMRTHLNTLQVDDLVESFEVKFT